jgi:succinate dehydrogenase / fumarate reductase cytochrome b subunit
LGKLVLFCSLFAFYYHLSNGIRHLSWDLGHGLSLTTTEHSNRVVIAVAAALTLFTWL